MSQRGDEEMALRLLEAERRIVEAQDRYDALGVEKGALDIELQSLHLELDQVVRRLEALGRSRVELGDLRRTTPLSPVWGLDRGVPLDRSYIHRFLDRHRLDIKGRVLEVKDAGYTRMFGDARVTSSDVLDVDPDNAQATIVTDLSQADAIATGTYDCFILTQTLGVIFDVAGAVRHAVRVLKPGGVLLCTMPACGRISYEEGLGGDFWRFTEASVRRLFSAVLPAGAFDITGHGNVLASAAFLYGMAVHELTQEELDAHDPYFPVVYTVRAVKPASQGGSRAAARGAGVLARASASAAAVLTYHRIGDRAHEADDLTVPAGEFAAQMRHLRDAGYQVMALDQMVASLAGGTLSGRAVSLTFDDGYTDAWSHVVPVLASCGFPATFFIVGAALDGRVRVLVGRRRSRPPLQSRGARPARTSAGWRPARRADGNPGAAACGPRCDRGAPVPARARGARDGYSCARTLGRRRSRGRSGPAADDGRRSGSARDASRRHDRRALPTPRAVAAAHARRQARGPSHVPVAARIADRAAGDGAVIPLWLHRRRHRGGGPRSGIRGRRHDRGPGLDAATSIRCGCRDWTSAVRDWRPSGPRSRRSSASSSVFGLRSSDLPVSPRSAHQISSV